MVPLQKKSQKEEENQSKNYKKLQKLAGPPKGRHNRAWQQLLLSSNSLEIYPLGQKKMWIICHFIAFATLC